MASSSTRITITPPSPFHIPVDLSHTALLLSDIQIQILARFPKPTQEAYLSHILRLLTFFRSEISTRRSTQTPSSDAFAGVPLIIHHTFPFNLNSNAFISPYNKLAKWVAALEAKGFFANAPTDPNRPDYAVPPQLAPPQGWGKDEILLPKIQTSCFGSSDLLAYLRARGVIHVVLVGLTTVGSILGSARQAADLDFHVVVPREGVIDDEREVGEFLLERVLSKFVDVVSVDDVLALGESGSLKQDEGKEEVRGEQGGEEVGWWWRMTEYREVETPRPGQFEHRPNKRSRRPSLTIPSLAETEMAGRKKMGLDMVLT